MANKYDFLQASLNETIYHIPDGVKLSITSNNFNQVEAGKPAIENLILYNPASGEDLSNEFRQTLDKIISVIPDHSSNSHQLNFLHLKKADFQTMHKSFGFKTLLCFGIRPAEIGIHVSYAYYQSILVNGITLLFSEAIEKLDKGKKLALWNSLQKMYGLK